MLSALLLALTIAPPGDVRFSVEAPDERGPLYLAGSFNDWQPGDPRWELTSEEERWTLSVPAARLGDAPIEFKLTRGSWDSVEVKADLTDRANRRLLAADLPEEVALTVAAWIDDRPDFVPSSARKSTVTGHLDVFEITSERLKNTRKLRVWLPPGYDAEENATRRYPVLYLHDGQNVFDRATSYLGAEWGADETATRLIEAGKIEPLLIIGIDHAGAARTAEYNPPFTSKGGVAHIGDRYLDFLTQTVMPEIEGRYRVEPGPEHTALGGSSYGGNITLYAGLRHPDKFGALLVESPVFWVFGSGLMNRCKQHEWTQRLFVAIGEAESKEAKVQAGYERGIEVLRATFTEQDLLPERALLLIEPKATHHETSWSRRLPRALGFFYGR